MCEQPRSLRMRPAASLSALATQRSTICPLRQRLTLALSAASKRPLLDRWAWNRKTASSDITPVVAATLALWGARTKQAKRPGRGAGRSSGRKAVVL